MKHIILTLTASLLIFNTTIIAQAVVSDPNQYESSWRLKQIIRDKLNVQEKSNPIDFSDIKGSPYLSETFASGKYFVDGESQGYFYLRYNIYNDEVEILTNVSEENLKSKTPSYDIFLKMLNSKIELNQLTIKPYNYIDDKGRDKTSYFIQLSQSDKYSLLLKKRCVLTPAVKASNPNQADRAAKFSIYNDYYIVDNNSTQLRKLELSKRKLLKSFPKHSEALKRYIKEEDISLKEEKDLIKLINYLSSL